MSCSAAAAVQGGRERVWDQLYESRISSGRDGGRGGEGGGLEEEEESSIRDQIVCLMRQNRQKLENEIATFGDWMTSL